MEAGEFWRSVVYIIAAGTITVLVIVGVKEIFLALLDNIFWFRKNRRF